MTTPLEDQLAEALRTIMYMDREADAGTVQRKWTKAKEALAAYGQTRRDEGEKTDAPHE